MTLQLYACSNSQVAKQKKKTKKRTIRGGGGAYRAFISKKIRLCGLRCLPRQDFADAAAEYRRIKAAKGRERCFFKEL